MNQHINNAIAFLLQFLDSFFNCSFHLKVSVPLATFIERMPNKPMVSIAVTGSLYKHHPKLNDMVIQSKRTSS